MRQKIIIYLLITLLFVIPLYFIFLTNQIIDSKCIKNFQAKEKPCVCINSHIPFSSSSSETNLQTTSSPSRSLLLTTNSLDSSLFPKEKLKFKTLAIIMSPGLRDGSIFNRTFNSLSKHFPDSLFIYSNQRECPICIKKISNYNFIYEWGNTYGDCDARVRWRTQVVLDYVHLLDIVLQNFECETLLTSEDDVDHFYESNVFNLLTPPFSLYDSLNIVQCPPDLIGLNKLSLTPKPFSGGGALSYMHNCTMLPQLKYYLLGNSNLKPLDWLVCDFYNHYSKMKTFQCNLVLHLGRNSSTKKFSC